MSLRSMTGHGFATVQERGVRVTVNISSVNRRQLDVAVKLPKMLATWEPRVEEVISSYVLRGRVSGTVDVEMPSALRRKGAKVDADLARGYVEALRKAARILRLKDDLSLSTVMVMPEVVQYDDEAVADRALWPIMERCLRAALQRLAASREQEGRHLQRDLAKRLRKIESSVRFIKRASPAVKVRYREQLLSRLREAGVETKLDDDRLLRELALFADRVDISEEITRLESHIAQFRGWLNSKETVGRTLDFAVQEMFREVNTIGSKANDIAISRQVVMLKTELERIREQVQNIE
jgi:uncharacterized protein (TIGR00255 family)